MAFCIVEEDPNYHKYMLSILINKTSGGGRESNPPKTLKPFNSFEDCGAHQALIHLHK